MLVRVLVSNMFSYYNETEFNMLVNPKRTSFPNHIYTNHPIPVLKQAALYGANGSGKSNLLNVLNFIQEIVKDKDFLLPKNFDLIQFALIEKNTKPSTITIEFLKDKKLFCYHISFDRNAILEEKLSLPLQDNQVIFIRQYQNKISTIEFYDNNNKLLDQKDTTHKLIQKGVDENHFASLLALNKTWGNILPNDCIDSASNWFEDSLIILNKNPKVNNLSEIIENGKGVKELVSQLLNKLDIGIEGIEVLRQNLDSLGLSSDTNKLIIEKLSENKDNPIITNLKKALKVSDLSIENNNVITKKILLSHKGIGGYIGKLNFRNESEGTKQFTHLIPILYHLIHKEVVYVVDEIESSIHPALMKAFLKLYARSKTKGQLIFTTHEHHLLDQNELMRPDEVWFAEKSDEGTTHLYSLSDFKEHNTINIEKGYLAGRYGAIPFLGELDDLTL